MAEKYVSMSQRRKDGEILRKYAVIWKMADMGNMGRKIWNKRKFAGNLGIMGR